MSIQDEYVEFYGNNELLRRKEVHLDADRLLKIVATYDALK